MNAEQLASIAGVALSLAFSYIPGVQEWFDRLAKRKKQALMGGLLVMSSGAIFGLSCAGFDVGIQCTQAGAIGMSRVLINALVANQSTYLITRK